MTIRAFAMDFDGVHTDNRVIVDADGNESVVCSRVDGRGVELLREAGIAMCVITRERGGPAVARCRKLGIECVHGVTDKLDALDGWLGRVGIGHRAEVCYLGNDIDDAECMRACGFACAPMDAAQSLSLGVPGVIRFQARGGYGFVRAVADAILRGDAWTRAPKVST